MEEKNSCKEKVDMIVNMYGPLDQKEIEFYMNELYKGSKPLVDNFQSYLVLNMFYKHFDNFSLVTDVSKEEYIKLMLVSKKILEDHGMVILPYIISSKITKTTNRNSINTNLLSKIENLNEIENLDEDVLKDLESKLKNDTTKNNILKIIQKIGSSEFQIIHYKDPELNGKMLSNISNIVVKEVLQYINLI